MFYLLRTLKNVPVPAYVRRGHSRSAVINSVYVEKALGPQFGVHLWVLLSGSSRVSAEVLSEC